MFKIALKITKVLPILIFLFLTTSAQQIYFCQSHTEKGEPIGASHIWKIKSNGGYLYILLDNEQQILKPGIYYMLVDKYNGNEYKEFDSKTIKLVDDKTWMAYNYIFKEPGKYKFSFISPDQQKISEAMVTIRMKGGNHDIETFIRRFNSDRVKSFFCEWVISEKPVKVKSSTNLKKNNGLIFFYINSQTPLNTDTLFVEIWKKAFSDVEYDQHIETKKYKIIPTWDYTFFRYQFVSAGEYRFDVYDQRNKLITAGYITVK